MDLSLAFLGTGGSVPTARRATACLLIRAGVQDREMVESLGYRIRQLFVAAAPTLKPRHQQVAPQAAGRFSMC